MTGLSRKILHDWGKGDLLPALPRWITSPPKNPKKAGWNLYSLFDAWSLCIYKHLRDWGLWLDRLRPKGEKPPTLAPLFYGQNVPTMLYGATFLWVYRIPLYLVFNENFIRLLPAEREGERTPGRPTWKVKFLDDPLQPQFHSIRLLPLMDHVASGLSRADFKIILTPVGLLEQQWLAAPSSVPAERWEEPVQFMIDGHRLELEPIPEDP